MAISVLVVDDSVVVRRLVSSVLDEDPDIRVVGTAANGRLALAKLPSVAPDLITLDIEMPELDGLATLRELRRVDRATPVVMVSTLTERSARATLDALALGAADYVPKPANIGSVAAGMEMVRAQLVPKIKALRPDLLPAPRLRAVPRLAALPGRAVPVRPHSGLRTAVSPQVLAVGCSTGGPEALGRVLRALPADLPVPVVVVQHMPPVFTAMFAQRLDRDCALSVGEARDGDELLPGRVLLAPGDHHMRVRREGTRAFVALDQGPPKGFCRPAVDPLFRSLAETFGPATLAVVLTGMGSDGRKGAEALRGHGCEVLVQDEETSVVWGMPGAITAAGLATAVLPLPAVAPALLRVLTGTPDRGTALPAPLRAAGSRWDGATFQMLTDELLPRVAAGRPETDRALRLWSAASSTGQEAYSIAMLLADWLPAHHGWSASVLGTDISSRVVERARSGRYTQLEVNRGLPAGRLVRHFRGAGAEWQLSDEIRRLTDFQVLNLAAPLTAMEPFDVVFCRNVLIYFDTATRQQILARIARVLRPTGFLVLGAAETTLNIDTAFERWQFGRASCHRLRGSGEDPS